jgi:hypothetical protein
MTVSTILSSNMPEQPAHASAQVRMSAPKERS